MPGRIRSWWLLDIFLNRFFSLGSWNLELGVHSGVRVYGPGLAHRAWRSGTYSNLTYLIQIIYDSPGAARAYNLALVSKCISIVDFPYSIRHLLKKVSLPPKISLSYLPIHPLQLEGRHLLSVGCGRDITTDFDFVKLVKSLFNLLRDLTCLLSRNHQSGV